MKIRNLKEEVHDAILKDIVNGTYTSGEIVSEKQLLTKHRCSRSPVREALTELCSEGIVKSIPRCGYQILPVSARETREILQYRYILEAGCLRFSYLSIKNEQLDHLREISALCNEEDDGEDSMWRHWGYNEDFHLYLISCAWNSYAYESLKMAMSTLKRAYAQFYQDKWVDTQPMDMTNHEVLIRELESKDIDGAIKTLYKDLEDFTFEPQRTLL